MAYGKSSGLVFDAQELGYLYDSSVNHHTLTNHGATPVRGKFGKGMYFDGVNDYVDCGNDASLNIIDAITIEAWVKTSDNTLSTQNIVNKRQAAAEGNYLFRINSGYIGFYFYNGAWLNLVDDTTKLSNDLWYHVGATYDRVDIRLNVNGIEVKSVDQTAIMIACSNNLVIGRRSGGASAYLNGSVASVKIYNRVLTAAEISTNYKSHGFYGSKMQSPKSLV